MKVYISHGAAYYFLKAPTEARFTGEPIEWVPYPVKRFTVPGLFAPAWRDGVDSRYRQLAEYFEDGAVVCYSLSQVEQFFDFYLLYREIARLPRRKEIKLILGGSLVGWLESEDLLERYPRITTAVVGPGERVLPELLDKIHRGQEVPRLVYGDPRDRSAWPDVSVVDAPDNWYYCSLGLDKCSWGRCKFCHHQQPDQIDDATIEQFCDKVIRLHREHDVTRFYIFDNNMVPSNLEILLQTLKASGLSGKLDIALFGARLDPGFVELAPLVRELGVISEIDWGLESCSQRVLNLYAKGTRVDHFEPILKAYAEAGVDNIVYGLYGLPRVTEDDLRDSFPRIDRLRPHCKELHLSWFLLSKGLAVYREKDRFGIEVLERFRMSDTTGFDCLGEHNVATNFFDFRSTIDGKSLSRWEDFERHLPCIRRHWQTYFMPHQNNTLLYFLGTPHAIDDPVGILSPRRIERTPRATAPAGHQDIRELSEQHAGHRALILGKGPSLDVWLDRGGLQSDRDDLVIVATNEAVMIPELAPDYWFWTRVTQPAWVEHFGGAPGQVVQVVPSRLLREQAWLLARTTRGRRFLTYAYAHEAPGDSWAVPGRNAIGPAAFFCCGAWGIKEITAVGFDGIDAPQMKSYASCLRPWLHDVERQRSSGFQASNSAIQATIARFGLEVSWYHRELSDQEIREARERYDTDELYNDPIACSALAARARG